MAPLPHRDLRHPWLRYQVEGYDKGIVHSYNKEAANDMGMFGLPVHVLDFAGLTNGMRQTLADRFSMGLRGLSVVASELPLINLHELRRLNICLRVGDTRGCVAPGPERQQAAAAGAPGAAKDAPAADKGAQAVPALMQAHKPSPPAPQHQTMT
ncbi:hypothetical protein Tco_0491541 [Tanacetum coccineum]